MAQMIKTQHPNIDLNSLSRLTDVVCSFDDKQDTLFIRSGEPRPAVSFDLDGEIWLRVDPTSGDIVGLEIDDFESIFLKKHPELSKAWKQAKPYCHKKKPSRHTETERESFISIILNFLSSLWRDCPPQSTMMAY